MCLSTVNGFLMKNIIIFVIGFFFPLNVYGSELLMVHEHGCTWCETWEEEIGNIYPKTREGKFAPLKRVAIDEIREIGKFNPQIVYTPTFLLLSGGNEIGRIEGYPGEDFFWALLNQLLVKKTTYKETLE